MHRVSKKPIALLLIAIAVLAGLSYLSPTKSVRLQSPSNVREIEELRQLAASDPQKLAKALDHRVVRIDAGDFVMGSDSGRADEHPQHAVYLDAF